MAEADYRTGTIKISGLNFGDEAIVEEVIPDRMALINLGRTEISVCFGYVKAENEQRAILPAFLLRALRGDIQVILPNGGTASWRVDNGDGGKHYICFAGPPIQVESGLDPRVELVEEAWSTFFPPEEGASQAP